MLGKDHFNQLVHQCVESLKRAEASGVKAHLLKNALRVFSKYEEEVEQLKLVVGEGEKKLAIIRMV